MLADFLRFLTGRPPEMNQAECEAFIDAVVFAMMADRVVDPDEMEQVESYAAKLPWQSEASVDDYVRQSLAAAAQCRNFATQAEPYLRTIVNRMRSSEVRAYTRDACLSVTAADGETTRTEKALEELVKQVFN